MVHLLQEGLDRVNNGTLVRMLCLFITRAIMGEYTTYNTAILGMGSVNERIRYIVHTLNDLR